MKTTAKEKLTPRTIVDGQHPHDFIMELAALYDLKLGENSLISFYFAPMGVPAMGPGAYPHCASASEDRVAAGDITSRDSTHIADDVITAGVLSSSIFYGIIYHFVSL